MPCSRRELLGRRAFRWRTSAGAGAFGNTQATNPGRYNFIDGFPARVLFDYAHNADGFREMCAVVSKIPVAGRRILYTRGWASTAPHSSLRLLR